MEDNFADLDELVSVIICTRNRGTLVKRAIDSVFRQKACNIEIIVIDDASSDGTSEVLKETYRSDIQVLSNQMNFGVAASSNFGFREAKGAFIALLGDDDYWTDSLKIRKQLDLMLSYPTLGVTGTWWLELKADSTGTEKRPIPPSTRYHMVNRLLASGGFICGSTALVAREAWQAVDGMDTSQIKGTDSDLFRRIALAGFDVNLIQETTTCVDTGHGLERMTPTNNIAGKRRQLRGQLQVVRKHNLLYLKYPQALVVRIWSVLRAILSFLRVSSQGQLEQIRDI